MLDLEWNGHSRTCPFKATREAALEHTKLMLREMEAHTGKRPIIYTDITFHREVLEGELPDYPHWVRSTAAEPHERYSNRSWTMWQYTTTGRVPGIEGDVDRNAFYGGDQEWAAFLATNCDPRQFRQLAARGSCTGTSAWAQKIPSKRQSTVGAPRRYNPVIPGAPRGASPEPINAGRPASAAASPPRAFLG